MEVVVAKIKKTKRSEIWICVKDYRNKRYVDLREHFLIDDDNEMHPTKKGLMVPLESLPDLIDGMGKLDGVTEIGTVATVSKSDHEEIQIGLREYQKTQFGDIRIWYWKENSQDRKPTPKGITFKPEIALAIIDALRQAEDSIT